MHMAEATSLHAPLERLAERLHAEGHGNVFDAEFETDLTESNGPTLCVLIDPHDTTSTGRAALLYTLFSIQDQDKEIFVSSVMENEVIVRLHPEHDTEVRDETECPWCY